MMRVSLLGACVSAILASAGCSGAPSAASGATGGTGDERFTRWTLPGVTLHRSCAEEQDDGSCGVWGRDDATGARLTGPEVFARLPSDLDAAVLAERAQDLLLGASGEPVLTPESAAEQRFVTAEERTVITTPRLEGDALVFYAMQGEMHPTAVEVRIARGSGAVTYEPVIEVWVRRAPASAGPLCMPLMSCGCDQGCVRVDRVALPDGGERFRRLDEQAPSVLYRVQSFDALEPLNQPCTEACPPHAPTYSCTLAGEACAQAPLPTAPPPTQ